MLQTGSNRILSGDDWVCLVVYTDDTTKTVYVNPKCNEQRAVFTAARYDMHRVHEVKSVTAARRWQVDPHYRDTKR